MRDVQLVTYGRALETVSVFARSGVGRAICNLGSGDFIVEPVEAWTPMLDRVLAKGLFPQVAYRVENDEVWLELIEPIAYPRTAGWWKL